MAVSIEILSAARISATYLTLKDKQEEVLVNFLSGHDVFAVLPTGKSLCYTCLPKAIDIHVLDGTEGSIVVAVMPLVAIIEDQVRQAYLHTC